MRGSLALRSFAVGAVFTLVACGAPQPPTSDVKIIGGEDVPANQNDMRARATVALTTEEPRSGQSLLDDGKSFCSGTVISERVILTAAHCLQAFDPETRQKLPELVLPRKEDFIVYFDNRVSRSGNWIRAEDVIPHPDWSPAETLSPQPASPPNDIGLIVLSEPIPATAQAAPLAPMDLNLSEGTQTYLVGFGVTRSRNNNDTGVKRQVTVPLNSVDAGAHRITVGEMMRGACAGDSGGPAYVKVNDEFHVIGATSTGAELFGMCLGLVNNYTDARYYKAWIEQTVGHLL